MKRTMKGLLCAAVLACVLACCLSISAFAEGLGPDGSVLFEKDGVKVTTAGLDRDPTTEKEETIIWLDIENSGDKDAYLCVETGSVNGFMKEVYLIDFYMEDGEYYGGNYGT